jgi:hypothetical protein
MFRARGNYKGNKKCPSYRQGTSVVDLTLRAIGKKWRLRRAYDRVATFVRQWKIGQIERVNSASKGTDDWFLQGKWSL